MPKSKPIEMYVWRGLHGHYERLFYTKQELHDRYPKPTLASDESQEGFVKLLFAPPKKRKVKRAK